MTIADGLTVLFASNKDTILITSQVQAVIFLVDFCSPIWLRQILMSGSSFIFRTRNRHIGFWIFATTAALILHAGRRSFCSYGGLTVFTFLNTFVNTLGIPLVTCAISDGVDLGMVEVLWAGLVKSLCSITTGFLLFQGVKVLGILCRLVWAHPFAIGFLLATTLFILRVVPSSSTKLKQLSISLLSRIGWIALISAFKLFDIAPACWNILSWPLRTYARLETGFINWRKSRIASPLYTYQQLGHRQMRLLKIRRRLPFTEIQCELFHANIDDPPEYTAISYTWGVASPTEDVLIDGARARVTSTVHDILHHQRSYFYEKVIWVDSICINQSDTTERSEQVVFMRDIFQKANGVLAWLGKTQSTFFTIAAILGLFLNQNKPSKPELAGGPLFTGSDEEWKALGQLLKHPWLSRSWVVQEVAVASKVRIVAGHVVIPWEFLEHFLKYMTATPHIFNGLELEDEEVHMANKERQSLRGGLNGTRMATVRNNHKNVRYVPLQNILQDCLHFRSSDPRDRIYAFLGLTNDGSRDAIVPDYTKSIEDVYTDAMRFMLTHDGSAIRMLLRAGIGYPRKSGANLPSWVPDFSDDKPTVFTVRGAGVHKAGSTYLPNMVLPAERPELFALKGSIVAEVKDLGPILELENLPTPPKSLKMTKDDPSLNYLRQWYRETMSLIRSHFKDPYPSGQPFDEIIWRTFISDTDPDLENPAPIASPRLGSHFEDWKWCFLGIGDDDEELDVPGLVTIVAGDMKTDDDTIHRIMASATMYMGAFGGCMIGMRTCITAGGSLAIVPPDTRPGDLISVFWGASAPYLIRPLANVEPIEGFEHMNYYNLVGCCYMHGVMKGEIEMVEGEEGWIFLL
ncbi:hypothetical protein FQN54_001160 [Arachnomyces sp. PD_36]|nr:hypothetical protein FQN54_001160 [Arachnomyces sp. PD_36]